MEATSFDGLLRAARHSRQWSDFWNPWCTSISEEELEYARGQGKMCRHPRCNRQIVNRAKTCKAHAYWYRVAVAEPARRFLAASQQIAHLPGDLHIIELDDLHGCTTRRECVKRIRETIEDYRSRLVRQWWNVNPTL